MKKKNLFYLFFLLLIPAVSAGDLLTTIFEPIGKIDFARVYSDYWVIIDLTIYLIMFLAVARLTFAKWYSTAKPAGKAMTAAVGSALAISLTYWSSTSGFRIGNLGPFAAIVFMLVFLVLIYEVLKAMGMHLPYSAAWTFLLFYVVLRYIFNPLYLWITTSAPILSALIGVGFLISIIYVIISITHIFKREGGDVEEEGFRPREEARPEQRRNEREQQRRREEVDRLENIREEMDDYENQLEDILRDLSGDELARLQRLGQLIGDLARVSQELNRRPR
ncbi:MAG: hypothetical protein ABIC04_02115 [Nanoarchaeota archaeon]